MASFFHKRVPLNHSVLMLLQGLIFVFAWQAWFLEAVMAIDLKNQSAIKIGASDTTTSGPKKLEEVVVKPHRFLIPKDHLKQRPPGNNFVEIYASWPDMKGYKGSKHQSHFDSIHILIASSRSPGEIQQEITTEEYLARINSNIKKGLLAESVPIPEMGLFGYAVPKTHRTGYEYYHATDPDVQTPSGRDLFIHCNLLQRVKSDPGTKECDVRFMFKGDLKIIYRFFIRHLPDWKPLNLAVMNLLNTFIVEDK